MSAIEYQLDELRLLPNQLKPDEAIAYVDGIAEIDPVGDSYDICAVWCADPCGRIRFVLVDHKTNPALFSILCSSIRTQFDSSIMDRVNDFWDEQRDEAGSRPWRAYA